MFEIIRKIYRDQNEFRIVLKLSSFFLLIFLLYLIANYFIVYSLSINDIKEYLESATVNVASDFEYKNGQWNTEKYLSDIYTPTEIPLYIFSIDGFLMDRLNVIRGFLDTSNFDYASSFSTPKTFTSLAGETWRAYSYFIKRNDHVHGVILVAYFDPRGLAESEIDADLQEAAANIDSKVEISGDVLDLTNVRQKDIDRNLSFEIVDIFNKSLVSYGGPPAYIDKSYIQEALKQKDFRMVEDKTTKSKYLLRTKPITSNNQAVGIVVAGKGLDQLGKTLRYQLLLSVMAGLIAIVLFVFVVIYLFRRDISEIVQERLSILSNPAPPEIKTLWFDKYKGTILVNKDILIPIPQNSHQYDVCKLFFQFPKKKMDTIDLIDAMRDKGTSKSEPRTVYDTILAINDKVKKILRKQLIQRKQNQYFINPELATKIRQ